MHASVLFRVKIQILLNGTILPTREEGGETSETRLE